MASAPTVCAASTSSRFLCGFGLSVSAALELCWTAAGRLRGCQSIGVSLYDVAGGICVARETGADAAWLGTNGGAKEAWSAGDMLEHGKREDDLLITAPAGTRAYLGEKLRFF